MAILYPTVQPGNCPRRRYVPELVEMVRTGAIDPHDVLTKVELEPASALA